MISRFPLCMIYSLYPSIITSAINATKDASTDATTEALDTAITKFPLYETFLLLFFSKLEF